MHRQRSRRGYFKGSKSEGEKETKKSVAWDRVVRGKVQLTNLGKPSNLDFFVNYKKNSIH